MTGESRTFWVLRVLESTLLLAMLVGIGLFAWSLVDIVRIETGNGGGASIPPSAWPGVAVFGGSLVLLQVVRIVLHRYRRDDGTPRAGARGDVAAATAEALAGLDDPSAEVETDTATGA